MIASTPLPGIEGKTVVVIHGGEMEGPAVCGSLIASGASVIATGTSDTIPASLVDAGIGLPGELHYRPLPAGDWSGLVAWIGAHAGKLSGIVGAPTAVTAATEALASLLAPDAVIVALATASAPGVKARHGIRSHSVVLAGGRGSRPHDVGAAVAFLLSDLTAHADGAVIPVGERPADRV